MSTQGKVNEPEIAEAFHHQSPWIASELQAQGAGSPVQQGHLLKVHGFESLNIIN